MGHPTERLQVFSQLGAITFKPEVEHPVSCDRNFHYFQAVGNPASALRGSPQLTDCGSTSVMFKNILSFPKGHNSDEYIITLATTLQRHREGIKLP